MNRQLWAMRPPMKPSTEIDPQDSEVNIWRLFNPPNEGNTEENLSREEKLRRERQRIHAVRFLDFFQEP